MKKIILTLAVVAAVFGASIATGVLSDSVTPKAEACCGDDN